MRFSIRSFTIIVIVLSLAFNGFIFYKLTTTLKENLHQLIQSNLQKDVLNIKHFLGKEINPEVIAQKTAHLDNFVVSNEVLLDIHLLDENNQAIYTWERDTDMHHQQSTCSNIANISQTNLLQQECYYTILHSYDTNKKLHLYKLYIYTNSSYIDSILQKPVWFYTLFFIFFTLFFTFMLWMSIKYILIVPFYKLLQYAENGERIPPRFKLFELETLRTSLKTTFKRLQHEQTELYKLSIKDPLSGLYNRASLMAKLQWLIAQSKRNNEKFAIIFFDLDNFKFINDANGHSYGDIVIQDVARRLLHITRKNDIVARFGGDEFVILLSSIQNEMKILEFIKRLKYEFSQPIVHKEKHFTITASVGIAIFPKDGQDPSTLLKNADIAMYQAKNLGKNSFSFFTESLNKKLQDQAKMRELIETALQERYFQLYYQPKVDLQTNKIVGCEALIRLIDPNKGIIPPSEFIPVAEQEYLIKSISDFVLEEATKQLQKWSTTKLKDISISINLSGVSFKDDDLVETIQFYTKQINTSLLDLEITETVLVDNFQNNRETIEEIKAMGITFSLDDFGTGYSSLSYLKNIPFDTIKIDQSFTSNMVDDEKDRLFVKTIISIAKNLNKKVVAEGVETVEQRNILELMGCDVYQGYLCSKPVPASEFENLFISHKCY